MFVTAGLSSGSVRKLYAVMFVLLTGCGRIGFEPLGIAGGDDGGVADGIDAPTSCTAFGPWGTPRRITELATTADEYGVQIMADGLTLYFDRHGTVADELFVARRPDRSSPFGVAQALPELGMGNSEGSATARGDELEIYFESSRSGTVCIYRATRSGDVSTWGTPVAVTTLCGSATEGPFLTHDGLTLYYSTASPPTDSGTIMVSQRASTAAGFPTGTPIVELMSGATKGYPVASSDGLTVYFESGSPTDLFEATRPTLGSAFGAATQIQGINTASIEQDVSISADGLELFFGSDRLVSGDLDLYVATRTCI